MSAHTTFGLCQCFSTSGSYRRLVVAFDGTENQFSETSSNVVEFYARIVKDEKQLSYYNSGIGTYVKPSNSKRFRTLVKNKWESLTASNFKANLLSGYRWLSENYQVGDQIYLLGFSRGAYQARVLAAMIHKVGLICAGNEEQIPFAFDIYKDHGSSELLMCNSDGAKQSLADKFKESFCRTVKIHFVGVWDTVSSVGLFKSKDFPNANRAENICFFRHALALDECRVKFIPEYVEAPSEFFSLGEYGQPRCKEVWFQGSHSDVGGGNKNNPSLELGGVPSRWMAYEAMIAGLELTPLKKKWDWNELKAGKPTNSMAWYYVLPEHLPFMIKWLDHSNLQYTRRRHLCRGRTITSKQRIHVSILVSNSDGYKPAADPPTTLEWESLVGCYRRMHGSPADRSDESDAFFSSSVLEYASRASSISLSSSASESSDVHDGPNDERLDNSPNPIDSETPGAHGQDRHRDDPGSSQQEQVDLSPITTKNTSGTDRQDLHPRPVSEPSTSESATQSHDDLTGVDFHPPSFESPRRLSGSSMTSFRSNSYSGLAGRHFSRSDSPNSDASSHSLLRTGSPARDDSDLRVLSSRQPPARAVSTVVKDIDSLQVATTIAIDPTIQWLGSLLELDHFDSQIIPTLVDAVVERNSNTIEFLHRLNLLAHTEAGISKLRDTKKCAQLVNKAFEHDEWELGMSFCWELYRKSSSLRELKLCVRFLAQVIGEDKVKMTYKLRAALLFISVVSRYDGLREIRRILAFALKNFKHYKGSYSNLLLKKIQRLADKSYYIRAFWDKTIVVKLYEHDRKTLLQLSMKNVETFQFILTNTKLVHNMLKKADTSGDLIFQLISKYQEELQHHFPNKTIWPFIDRFFCTTVSSEMFHLAKVVIAFSSESYTHTGTSHDGHSLRDFEAQLQNLSHNQKTPWKTLWTIFDHIQREPGQVAWEQLTNILGDNDASAEDYLIRDSFRWIFFRKLAHPSIMKKGKGRSQVY